MVVGHVKGYRQPLDILHWAEGYPVRYWFPISYNGHGLLELGVGVCWVEPENCFCLMRFISHLVHISKTIRQLKEIQGYV